MSYLYVPGLELPTSGSSGPFEGKAEPFCMSSGMPTQRPSSWRGWKTRPWIERLSGTISRPSTADLYAGAWISSLQASRANPTASRAAFEAIRTAVRSGLISPEWWGNQSQRLSSLRTSRGSRSTRKASGSPFETWVSSGLRRSFKTPTHSGHLTDENGYSCSLPTPSASSYGSNVGGAAGRVGPRRESLETMVRRIPTPTAGDAKASGAAGYSTSSGRHSGTTLTDWAVGAASEGRTGRLNPLFSEWLMGLPLGWTVCTPLGTQVRPPSPTVPHSRSCSETSQES